MSGGGRDAPPAPVTNGGDFLLSLLHKTPHHHQPAQSQPPQPQQHLAHDPAVAIVGPTVPFPPSPWLSNGDNHLPPRPNSLPHSLSPPYLPNFLGFPPGNSFPGNQLPGNLFPGNFFLGSHGPFSEDSRKSGFSGVDARGKAIHNLYQHNPQEQKFVFGSFTHEIQNPGGLINGNSVDNSKLDASKERDVFSNRSYNELDRNRQFIPGLNPRPNANSNLNSAASHLGNFDSPQQEWRVTGHGKQHNVGNYRSTLPPGFPSNPSGEGNWDSWNRARGLEHNVDKRKLNSGELRNMNASLNENNEKVRNFSLEDGRIRGERAGEVGLSRQVDNDGHPTGSSLHSASAMNIEDSALTLQRRIVENEIKDGNRRQEKKRGDSGTSYGPQHHGELDDSLVELGEQLVDTLLDENESHDKNDKRKHHNNSREKDSRSDDRGQWMLSQRMRNFRRHIKSRSDIDKLSAPLLAIYESLIPAEEVKAKQKQLLTTLEKLVWKEWPEARLYLYGSCANSFGVSKSDIDVCLAMEDADINKSEVLLKLAHILQSDNLQNVQALTRARVPIVKLMDPVTGISCDICINNVLAVVNTKLLRDYALIDARLWQLAFIVKHWAKSRGVNETYQGTLSSYAYVIMCIHFLQQRKPAILPCLQGMEITYSVTVDDIKCAYFDQVESLRDFGSHNRESIAQLVWAFFNYWAFHHDYANDVISVRTGSIISKRAKDWTRRIGNDRHLICIEDPFEISHDLGRVVDKYSIKVLREEFERAAYIMQHDPNPCATLFEPYVPS